MARHLPLPRAGRIRHIIHVADIHIRPGIENKNDKKSRYTEYLHVFQRILAFVRETDKDHDTVMCIAGDILHDNKKVGASCIELFYEILSHISACIPIYIICGNHDYNQASIESQDLLSSLAHPLHHANNNIAYLQETGVYSAANVDFGLLAIQSVLRAGNTHGAVKELPAFPRATPESEGGDKKTRVALFHGDVFGQYPIQKILSAGYDVCMLGDLHGQQIYNATSVDKKTFRDTDHPAADKDVFRFSRHRYAERDQVYAYAGSTIQQNYGEPLLGHGFLLWDLEDKTVDSYHVRNDYGFINISSQQREDAEHAYIPFVELKKPYRYDDPGKSNTCGDDQPSRVPLSRLREYSTVMPRILRVRFKLHENIAFHDPQFIDNTIAQLRSMGHDIESSDVMYLAAKHQERAAASAQGELDDLENVDIKRFNSPAVWCEYLEDRMPRDVEWQTWVHDPAMLKMRHVFAEDAAFFDRMLPDTIKTSILDRDTKTEKECEIFRQDLDSVLSQDAHRHVSFEILDMAWSYILCFGPHCFFDFRMLDRKVHCIGGKNGYGKTSFLETVCIALFGEGFPSRTSKHYTSSILHKNLPKNTRPFTSINIRLNNADSFNIKRVFCRNSTDKNKLTPKEVVISKIDGDDGAIASELHSGTRATQQWISNNVGTMQTFLTSCMISQNNEHDFFDKKPAEQKAYLDQQLHFSSTNNFLSTLKSSSNAHKDITTRLHDALHFYHENMQKTTIDDARMEELEARTQEAHAHIAESEAFVSAHPISLLVQNDFQQVLASKDMIDGRGAVIPKDQVQTALQEAFERMSEGSGSGSGWFDLSFCKENACALRHEISQKQNESSRLSRAWQEDASDLELDMDILRQNYRDHLVAGEEARYSNTKESIQDILLFQDRKNKVQADIERYRSEFGGDTERQKEIIENLEKEWRALKDEKKKRVEENTAVSTDLVSIEKDMQENQKKMDAVLLRQQMDTTSSTIDEETLLALKDRIAGFMRDYNSLDTVVQYIEKLEKRCNADGASVHLAKSALQIEMLREENKNILRKCKEATTTNDDAFPSDLSEKLDTLRKQAQTVRERRDALMKEAAHQHSLYDSSRQTQERCLANFETVMQERPPAMRVVTRKEDPEALRHALRKLESEDDDFDACEMARARGFVEAYPALESKMKRHNDICSLLEQCEDYPFNPACAACLNHPWKKKRESLLATKRDLEENDDEGVFAHYRDMDELSKMYSHFSDYLYRMKKRRDDKEDVEGRLKEAREACEAEERESAWCQQKDGVQEELSCAKKACRMAQEDLDKCSSERDVLTRELSALEQTIAFSETCASDREAFMKNEAEITAWTKWTKKNEKKLAFEKIRDTWKEDVAREKECEKAWQVTLQKKRDASTVQHCHGQVQRLQQEKDGIMARIQENQNALHQSDMDMLRIQQQLDQRRCGLRELEHACITHREITRRLCDLTECKAWHDKKDGMARQIESIETRHTLDILHKKIGELQSMYDTLQLQMRVIESFDVWYTHTYHTHRIKFCQALVTQTAPELTLLRDKKREYRKNVDMMDRLSEYVQKMGKRTRLLEQIMAHFACFKTWVIESKVIPSIAEKVNFLLRHFCIQHRNISLAYDFVPQKNDSGQIAWFIKEGHDMTLPIEKASGFQRFVINLAMRIVLGKFGICGIKNKQLFIDEGFTSFDQDNLENVPHILSELLLPLFKSIVIVTHLESIQNHIPSYIPITRDAVSATSSIYFGHPDCIPCGRKAGRPKKEECMLT